MVLHAPADADDNVSGWPDCQNIEVRTSRFSGTSFEQVYLPAVTAGKVLLNFEGTAPIFKRKQVVTMHDAVPFRRPAGFSWRYLLLHSLAYRWIARTAHGLVAETIYTAHELADVLKVDINRFIVAEGAADWLNEVEPLRPDLPVWGDHYLVIGSGSPHESIGAAAAAMANSGRRVVIIGMRRSDPTPHQSVVYAEQVTDAELIWLYQRSSALVLTANYAGSALAAIEAQALGCPVVATDSGAHAEVCRDAALYFDPHDPDTLTAQLDRLDSETGLAADLRRRGLSNASRYSWVDSIRKVTERMNLPHCPVKIC
ncbi:glycosyltransferase [Mycolicibacterium bacteremicum]|uniref:glycosyltransferase n=1 Tax=Mycolicibacterium bacteremicum TaxID=564198 RepID=UPI0013FE28F4|nr:glycosyltransferase [Mycolicibacterium bacteremicum]MCV7435361.1 glycosyltransferase [Mycolicibacterium bacteremicum]